MPLGTQLDPTQIIPDRLQEAIQHHFPDQQVSDLTIRYYETVGDVGFEYFKESILPLCHDHPIVQSLEPFISFINLGEALILAQDGVVVYANNHTETGPFWFVTPKEQSARLPG